MAVVFCVSQPPGALLTSNSTPARVATLLCSRVGVAWNAPTADAALSDADRAMYASKPRPGAIAA